MNFSCFSKVIYPVAFLALAGAGSAVAAPLTGTIHVTGTIFATTCSVSFNSKDIKFPVIDNASWTSAKEGDKIGTGETFNITLKDCGSAKSADITFDGFDQTAASYFKADTSSTGAGVAFGVEDSASKQLTATDNTTNVDLKGVTTWSTGKKIDYVFNTYKHGATYTQGDVVATPAVTVTVN